MTELSYMNWDSQSDSALEAMIGSYIKKQRQQQNKTQKELAKAANISRSTLSLLERGASGNLKTLIQILRVLGKLHVLEVFDYQEMISPLALAKAQVKERKRVKYGRKSKKASSKKKSSW